jgi:polar amino acid transport system substrate-binding protein
VATLLLPVAVGAVTSARAVEPAPFTLGTAQVAGSFTGEWFRRIYIEAFRRMEVPLTIVTYPRQRAAAALANGALDGETDRVHGYAAAHPELVRVEEPLTTVVLALFTTKPGLTLARLDELPGSGLRVVYRRGIAVCEDLLKPLLPVDRLLDVTEPDQALNMLLAGRTDLYCSADLALADLLATREFRGVATIRRVLDIDSAATVHAYLHRRHAALAPRLAQVLKQMKAEGVIERLRLEALDAAGR